MNYKHIKMKLKTALVLVTVLCTLSVFLQYLILRNNVGNIHTIKQNVTNILPRTESPILILLLAYMRSGSSLTGDILQQSPGAFYIFEPLRVFDINVRRNLSDYNDGTLRSSSPYQYIVNEEARRVLKNWLTCNLTGLPPLAFTDRGFLGNGLKSRGFNDCVTLRKDKGIHVRGCVEELQKSCEASPVRIIKTIRVDFSDIKQFFDNMPGLKIIHLMRDPRSTLLSQNQAGKCAEKRGGYTACVKKVCTRMENNALEEELLKQIYPDKLETVFYEQIARYPLTESRAMYKFCGMPFTDNARRYIYNITSAGNPDKGALSTVRSNSSDHIETWKEKMSTTFLNMIQERCNYVMRRYQYTKHSRSNF